MQPALYIRLVSNRQGGPDARHQRRTARDKSISSWDQHRALVPSNQDARTRWSRWTYTDIFGGCLIRPSIMLFTFPLSEALVWRK